MTTIGIPSNVSTHRDWATSLPLLPSVSTIAETGMPDASNDPLNEPAVGPRQLLWGAAFVMGAALAGGQLGGGIGGALGRLVPNYYRSVFRGGSDPGFDPVAAGIGQGLTQGVMLGAVVGLVLVAFSWRTRLARRAADRSDEAASASPRRSVGLLILIGSLSAACAGIPAFGVGYVGGLLGNDVSRGNRDVERVELIMAAEPQRYGDLSINRGPADKFLLEGWVNSQTDYDALRDRLVREFGEERADFVTGGVDVRNHGEDVRP